MNPDDLECPWAVKVNNSIGVQRLAHVTCGNVGKLVMQWINAAAAANDDDDVTGRPGDKGERGYPVSTSPVLIYCVSKKFPPINSP